MAKIQYDDKVSLNDRQEIAEINKGTADNFNEIKEKHNILDDSVIDLQSNQVDGILRFDTKALLDLETGVSTSRYEVTDDPTPSLNGQYKWNGSAFVKTTLQTLSTDDVTDTVSPTDTQPISSKGVSNSFNFINVTEEYRLPSGQFYVFSTAVVKIENTRKKDGLVLTYETSTGVWETITWKGTDGVNGWTDESYWFFNDNVIIGTTINSINKKYWKKGLIATFEESSEWKVKQYIGVDFPSTAVFRDLSNWIELITKIELDKTTSTVSLSKSKISSLETVYYSDPSKMNWINGSFNSTTGELTSTTDVKKIVTPQFFTLKDINKISCNPDYNFLISTFDKDFGFLATSGWQSTFSVFSEDTEYIMIQIKNQANLDLSPSDIYDIDLVLDLVHKSAQLKEYIDNRLMGVETLRRASVVNDWQNDKMAHVSTIVEDAFNEDGYLWTGYYHSTDTYTETISEDVICSLAKMNPCDFTKSEKFEALKKGDVVGGFQQRTSTAPYDPTIIVNENDIQFLMVADNLNDSEGVRYVQRVFDKTTETFANTIQNLNIRYVHSATTYTEVLSISNLNTMVDRLQGRTGTNLGVYPIFSGRIIQSGGYNWIYLGSLVTSGTGFQGAILKSIDGITWDFVSSPPLNLFNVWEGALEIVGDFIYVFIKGDTRYHFEKYNRNTDTWIASSELTGQKLQRPFLWYNDSKLYALYNAPDQVNDWGTVNRSTLAISVIDQNDLSILDTQIVKTDTGCHYVSATQFRGTNYFMFTEDRKKHDITQMKGQVSIIEMDFLKI